MSRKLTNERISELMAAALEELYDGNVRPEGWDEEQYHADYEAAYNEMCDALEDESNA